MKKKIKNLFFKLFARKAFQPIFEGLHWLALRGMNYGAADSPVHSGEVFFLNFIKGRLGKNIVIFDVGANNGQYANLANKVFEGVADIYAFEPTKSSYKILLKRFKDKANIKLFPFGMGNKPQNLEIFYNKEGSVQASAFSQGNKNLLSETVTISTVNIFCKERNISEIDLLKVDVEGFEFFVLQGANELLMNKKIRVIQFEFGSQHVYSKHFIKDFKELLPDFYICRLLQNGFVEIKNNSRFEIFQTSNYVAIRKDFVKWPDITE